MAWRITSGTYDGVALDGLAVVAAVSADRNLGMRELGGEAPAHVKAVVAVDERANDKQQRALVRFARTLSNGLLNDVVRVDRASIRFAINSTHVDVSASDVRLSVNKTMVHDPSCGAMQWFKPFSLALVQSAMGTADEHVFAGVGLGSKWSAPHKRSAFYGTFAYR
jgi:hypothetical protein